DEISDEISEEAKIVNDSRETHDEISDEISEEAKIVNDSRETHDDLSEETDPLTGEPTTVFDEVEGEYSFELDDGNTIDFIDFKVEFMLLSEAMSDLESSETTFAEDAIAAISGESETVDALFAS
ncbi:hypothetical protein, partial [Baaleninema sp.]|uniref:hypothetical protein n=1 Tax=Baaleninema sp. TaxID=3101197 RepID=UPI003D03CB14